MVRRKERIEPPPAYGWYRYQNTTGADFVLPRPLINGRVMVPRDGFFEADSSYQNTYGVKLVANLSHYIKDPPPKHILNKGQRPDPEPVPEVLVEQPVSESLKFFEADGTPVKQSTREKGNVDLTRKELIEFAKFKKIKVNTNWTKEKILECIRER